jgi:hypothetical protein
MSGAVRILFDSIGSSGRGGILIKPLAAWAPSAPIGDHGAWGIVNARREWRIRIGNKVFPVTIRAPTTGPPALPAAADLESDRPGVPNSMLAFELYRRL